MAGRSGDSRTSRLNTPRGNAGSSRQREHVSNVRGRYASLDSSSVNGSWAQRAAEARRANEERARNSSRTSEYELRAREARNRQLSSNEKPEQKTREARNERVQHSEEPERRVTRSYEYEDSASRLYARNRRTRGEYVSDERFTSEWQRSDLPREGEAPEWPEPVDQRTERLGKRDEHNRELRSNRADRRTVQLGDRSQVGYTQGYEPDDYSSNSNYGYQDDFVDDFGDEYDEGYAAQNNDAGIAERARGALGGIGDFIRRVPLPAWIVIGVILIVLVIALNVSGVFAGGGASASKSAASSSSSSSSSSSVSNSAAALKSVEDPWVESKVFTTGDAELDANIKELCDNESEAGLSASENAYRAYIAVAWSNYQERDDNQNPQGPDWTLTYAKQWFANGNSGNCYELTATTQYVLQYFGYSDAKAEPCFVELESGDMGDHGLVFVTDITDGSPRIVDDALGTNGWMLDEDALSYQIKDIGQNG